MAQRRPRFAAELSQCLFDFVIQLLPAHDELHVKESVRLLLQRLLRNLQPASRLLAFGSTANGFSLRNSDMDLCCLVDAPERLSPADLVTRLGDLLERETRFHVKPLPHARIPIVKLSLDPSPGLPSGIACDIGFENRLAIENTRLLLTYAKIDPTRVRTLVLFLKIWSKRRKINSPYKGTLSSYGYVLLVIYFLVHVKNPPVLPNLQQMPPLHPINKDETTLNGYNVWFFDDTDILCQRWQSENTESVAELLIDFFRYFSRDFLYNTGVASIRAGLLKKDVKGWQNDLSPTSVRYDPARERNRFCIEDPFETDYNVARCVTKDGLYTIRGEFMRASRILSIRPERAIMALAELCEERKDEDLVSAPSHAGHHHIPYVGNGGNHAAKLSIPPQTPYSIGTQSRSSLRVAPAISPRLTATTGSNSVLQVVDEDSILTTTRTNDDSPIEPVNVPLPPSPSPSPLLHSPTIAAAATSTSNMIPPIVNNTTNATKPLTFASPLPSFSNTAPNFVPPSTIPDQPHPEHMAPRRFKWTSPPPADAPFVDRTMYENSLDRSLELATAPVGEARETYRYKKRRDGQELTRWDEMGEGEMELEMEEEEEDDIGSVVETLSEVGSVRSFTEGMHFGSNANAMMNFGYSGVGMRRPSWHVMDSLPRGWVPPSFVPSPNTLKQLSQQQGEQEIDGVGSPTPTRNGFPHPQSPPSVEGEGTSQELEVPRESTTPLSTSPEAVSDGQPSPPIPLHRPVSYPTPLPYARRSRPPSQQSQYHQQNRGGYHNATHQPNHQRSPLIPFSDSPEVSPGFESASVAGSASNGRFNNGGYFGSQKVRGEVGLASPGGLTTGATQSPRFHRQHQHYQQRNGYGGGYTSPQHHHHHHQQRRQRSPQLAAFDSYALHLAMNNLNVINSVGGGMNVMNAMNASSSAMMDAGISENNSNNNGGGGGGGTTVFYQTAAPRSPRIVMPRQSSSNASSPQIGSSGGASSTGSSGSGRGSCATSPAGGVISGGGSGEGGVEENVLPAGLPSIGLMRHGQRNGVGMWNGVNAMEMVCGRGNGNGYGYGSMTSSGSGSSGVYASPGYQQLMMAASLRGAGINGVGYRRNGCEEEDVRVTRTTAAAAASTLPTSHPPQSLVVVSKTPVQSESAVHERDDDDDSNRAGDGCENSVGSTASSTRSSSGSDVTAATTAMTGMSSSPPGITTTTTKTTNTSMEMPSSSSSSSSPPPLSLASDSPVVVVNGVSGVGRSTPSAATTTKGKGKSRNKSRMNGAGVGGKVLKSQTQTQTQTKSRSPSPFVKPNNGSRAEVVSGGNGQSPLVNATTTATVKITKEEEERFHSSVGGGKAGGGEEKVGGRGKKNGGGEREKKNGNGNGKAKVKVNGSGGGSAAAATPASSTKNSGNPDSSNSKGRGKQKGKQRRGGNNNNNHNKKGGGDQGGAEKPLPTVAVASTSGVGSSS